MAKHKIATWLQNHLRALLFALGALSRAPASSIITILVIGIAMSFPAGLYWILKNIELMDKPWGNAPTISLYLQPGTDEIKVQNLMHLLKNNKQVADVRYVSPEQGLTEFQQQNNFSSALNVLPENPLPGVIIITPSANIQSDKEIEPFVNELKQLPDVDSQQLDWLWVKRFYQWMLLGKRITWGLMALFSLGVLLIIGNTIRMIIQNHQQEFFVLKLVGATIPFIRRPLLYRGSLYGLFGGVVAWFLVTLLFYWLNDPTARLSLSYHSLWKLKFLNFYPTLVILAICTILGWLGSWVSVSRFLNKPEEFLYNSH
ncbi:MAG: ABC transporter permease [Proteobacteria bacterium]|nr:ABC transporter permease [Pseudomonadota bacterium]